MGSSCDVIYRSAWSQRYLALPPCALPFSMDSIQLPNLPNLPSLPSLSGPMGDLFRQQRVFRRAAPIQVMRRGEELGTGNRERFRIVTITTTRTYVSKLVETLSIACILFLPFDGHDELIQRGVSHSRFSGICNRLLIDIRNQRLYRSQTML